MNSRSLRQRQHGLIVRVGDRPAHGFRRAGEALPGHAEVHGQGDQPLLRAVVQIPLDPAALGVGRGDDVGPAAGQRLDPLRQFLAAARPEQRPGRGLIRPRHLPGQPGRREQQPGRRDDGGGPGGGGRVARDQVGDRGHRGQPAGGHQPAAGHPGDDRQQVEPELPPGRGGEPRPDRPRPAPGRPRARRGCPGRAWRAAATAAAR